MDEAIPLAKDSLGVYRVGGTRVTLDLVVRAFHRGATAEEIVQKFPSLQLAGFAVVRNDLHRLVGGFGVRACFWLTHSFASFPLSRGVRATYVLESVPPQNLFNVT
jgi:hypothetical protein